MAVDDSMVVVGLVINNSQFSPLLKIVVSDPDGIYMYEVFSRHNATLPVEIVQPFGCPKRHEHSVGTFPRLWFPITVKVYDCDPQKPQKSRKEKTHGPFDEDGNVLPKQDQPTPPPKMPDVKTVKDLNQLPLVIDRADVRELLAVSDEELNAIIDCDDLVAFGASKQHITKGSLGKLLGL